MYHKKSSPNIHTRARTHARTHARVHTRTKTGKLMDNGGCAGEKGAVPYPVQHHLPHNDLESSICCLRLRGYKYWDQTRTVVYHACLTPGDVLECRL
jgi:hypothetical protein